MGLTASVMHILHGETAYRAENGRILTPGVTTIYHEDMESFGRACAKEAKKCGCALLAFSIYDSDEFMLALYEEGKKCASVQTRLGVTVEKKGVPRLAQLVSAEREAEKRLKDILSADGIETKIDLLEEFFGVPLAGEETAPPRGREKYDEWKAWKAEAEKALKSARAELIFERTGRIFFMHENREDLVFAPVMSDGTYSDRHCIPVEYRSGRLHAKMDRYTGDRVLTRRCGDGWLIADKQAKRAYRTNAEQSVEAEFRLPDEVKHVFSDGAVYSSEWVPCISGGYPGHRMRVTDADGAERWSAEQTEVLYEFFLGDKLYLASLLPRLILRRLDPADGSLVSEYIHSKEGVHAGIYVLPDGFLLAESDGSMYVLDETLRETAAFKADGARGISGSINQAFRCGERYIFWEQLNVVYRVDVQEKRADSLRLPEMHFLKAVSPDGSMAIAGGATLMIVSPEMEIIAKKRLKGQIVCCRFEEDGLYVLTHAARHGEWLWGFEDDCTARSYRVQL